MDKAILTVLVSVIIGIVGSVIGNDFLNGFSALGVIFSVSITGGFIVYFQDKKDK